MTYGQLVTRVVFFAFTILILTFNSHANQHQNLNFELKKKNTWELTCNDYENANFKIDCNNKEKSEITDEIIKLYEKN